MPQLLHLDGRPQTWDELHARRIEWALGRRYTASGRRRCGACTKGLHPSCSGSMAREEGSTDSRDLIPCGCECR